MSTGPASALSPRRLLVTGTWRAVPAQPSGISPTASGAQGRAAASGSHSGPGPSARSITSAHACRSPGQGESSQCFMCRIFLSLDLPYASSQIRSYLAISSWNQSEGRDAVSSQIPGQTGLQSRPPRHVLELSLLACRDLVARDQSLRVQGGPIQQGTWGKLGRDSQSLLSEPHRGRGTNICTDN